jgi:hypothetical protein
MGTSAAVGAVLALRATIALLRGRRGHDLARVAASLAWLPLGGVILALAVGILTFGASAAAAVFRRSASSWRRAMPSAGSSSPGQQSDDLRQVNRSLSRQSVLLGDDRVRRHDGDGLSAARPPEASTPALDRRSLPTMMKAGRRSQRFTTCGRAVPGF